MWSSDALCGDMSITSAVLTTDAAPAGLFRSAVGGKGSTLREMLRLIRQGASNAAVVEDRDFGLISARLPVPDDEKNIWRIYSIRDELIVIITQCNYRTVRQELVPGESFVEFHLTLDGEIGLASDPTDHMAFRGSNLVICRQDEGADYTVSCPAGHRNLVSIYARPHILTQNLAIDSHNVSQIMRELLEPCDARFRMHQLPIPGDIMAALRQMLVMPMPMPMPMPGPDRLHLHYFNAKAWELLCLCVSHLAFMTDRPPKLVSFSEREIQMFEKARSILEQQFAPQPTISSLARAIGTNTNKLKSGFKIMYGTTVFDYGHRHRMLHAMKKLVHENYTAGKTAAAIGYGSPASFSTAFRNYFGFPPNEARRRMSSRQDAASGTTEHGDS